MLTLYVSLNFVIIALGLDIPCMVLTFYIACLNILYMVLPVTLCCVSLAVRTITASAVLPGRLTSPHLFLLGAFSDRPAAVQGSQSAARRRHDISPESPGAPRLGPSGDGGGASDDSSDSREGLDSDGSVADLSAIIDAITRTHIADDAVIVISDDDSDDSDVLEVSGRELSSRSGVTDPAELQTAGGAGPESCSRDDVSGKARCLSDAGGKADSCGSDTRRTLTRDAGAAEARTVATAPPAVGQSGRTVSPGWGGDGQGAAGASEGAASTPDAGVESGADSDSDAEYVPLFRRLALA